jgi:hypothetical protein
VKVPAFVEMQLQCIVGRCVLQATFQKMPGAICIVISPAAGARHLPRKLKFAVHAGETLELRRDSVRRILAD